MKLFPCGCVLEFLSKNVNEEYINIIVILRVKDCGGNTVVRKEFYDKQPDVSEEELKKLKLERL